MLPALGARRCAKRLMVGVAETDLPREAGK
jgi:hypothetical protein